MVFNNIKKTMIIVLIITILVVAIVLISGKSNEIQQFKSNNLPKDVAIEDIEIVYLCKTTYDEEGNKKI